MMEPISSGVRVGDVLAGKYRVDRVLGAGGMGVVVAAHHLRLDERVAIKFLLPDMLASGETVARFEREARAAVKIKSEHVARVSDVGTLETGAPYMVMEYLEGSDLSGWLQQQGRLSFEQASDFVLQACEAIAEAHSLGIVHRDLKPANLFVIRRPDGALSVKVLDFGISKVTGGPMSSRDASFTRTNAVMGSPLYMSPEQMHSAKDVDSRTDIWALGVILYELVSGVPPFLAETMPELIARILSQPPTPLAQLRPDAPAGFEAMILRCLERDRERRYESVGQLAAELVTFAPRRARVSLERISGVLRSSGLSATALATPPSSDPTQNAPAATQAAFGRTAAPSGRVGLAVVGGVALMLLVGVLVLRRDLLPFQNNGHASDAAPAAPSASATQLPAAATLAAMPGPETPPLVASSAATPLAPTPAATPSARPREPISPAPRRPGQAPRQPSRQDAAPNPVTPPASKTTAGSPPPGSGAFDDRK
jgi:serine/threonine-protein kinase